MKRLCAVLLLAACAKAPEVSVPQGEVPGLLRNPTAPLASQTDANARRLVGTWYVRQSVTQVAQPGYQIEVSEPADGVLLFQSEAIGCVDTAALCESYDQILRLKSDGPGRWQVIETNDDFPMDPLWVLWLDFDDRTAAIGGPTGKFAWIMDRSATGGSDRIIAARDILDWYGYDTSKLVEVSP